MVGRTYFERGDKKNRNVIQSTVTKVTNGSPMQQNMSTIGYELKCVESYDVTITKTKQIKTVQKVKFFFIKSTREHIFTEQTVERMSNITERYVKFPSQNVTVEPFSKMNVTFNFIQYDDINVYFMDFLVGNTTMFSHPKIVNGNLVFVQTSLFEILQKYPGFVPTIKYENDRMLKLDENKEQFILRNFLTTEKMTNYGVDVIFSKAEKLSEWCKGWRDSFIKK